MGSEERGKKRLNVHQVLALVVSGMVLIALGYGLYLAGSPGKARKFQFDRHRLEDLRRLSSGIGNLVNETGEMPVSLQGLSDNFDEARHDPETGEPYAYRVMSETGYELCAVFSYGAQEAEESNEHYRYYEPVPVKMDTNHVTGDYQAGEHCWTLSVASLMGCRLMSNPATGAVDCFGCASGTCRSAPAGWEPFLRPSGTVGIPYACFQSKTGCALAQ